MGVRVDIHGPSLSGVDEPVTIEDRDFHPVIVQTDDMVPEQIGTDDAVELHTQSLLQEIGGSQEEVHFPQDHPPRLRPTSLTARSHRPRPGLPHHFRALKPQEACGCRVDAGGGAPRVEEEGEVVGLAYSQTEKQIAVGKLKRDFSQDSILNRLVKVRDGPDRVPGTTAPETPCSHKGPGVGSAPGAASSASTMNAEFEGVTKPAIGLQNHPVPRIVENQMEPLEHPASKIS